MSLPIYSTFDVEGIASGINQFIGLKYGIHGLNSTIKNPELPIFKM